MWVGGEGGRKIESKCKRENIFSSLFSVQQSIRVTAQLTGFSIWKGSGMFSLTILEMSSEKLLAY